MNPSTANMPTRSFPGTTIWFMRIHANEAETAWAELWFGRQSTEPRANRHFVTEFNGFGDGKGAVFLADAEAGARRCRLRYTLVQPEHMTPPAGSNKAVASH